MISRMRLTAMRLTAMRLTGLSFGLGLVIAVAACQSNNKAPVFPHDKHLAAGAGCTDCHTAAQAMRPQVATCRQCHEEASDPKFATATLEALTAERPARGENHGLGFDHKRHDGVDCGECHKASGVRMLRPTMATCLDACHGEAGGAPLTCRQCHATLSDEGKPASHTPEWNRRHGATARALRNTTTGSCLGSCHTENSCFTCHRTEKPENHTQHFRLRGHGVIAQADRERCFSSCHTTEYCQTCHLNTKPINHIGTWRGTTNNHCNNCHLPLSANSCSVCHLQAGHNTAVSVLGKAGHNPFNQACRTCHAPGAGMKHSDNGDNCESCHVR